MATGPQIPTDPIQLLTPDPDRIEPFINKYWGAGLCAALTFVSICFGQYASHRPVFSGIQKHILGSLGAGYIGHIIQGHRNNYLAERDAVLRHYISLHPEDFPVPERKKYSEVLESWVPIR